MDNKTLDLSKHSIMMEDIKFKFLGLINKQSQTKIPSMGVNPELLNPKDCEILKENESEASRSTDSQVLPDQEILESIEQIYYDESDGTFDPCRYELEKLPNVLDSKDIERYYKKLEQQHQVVSKKVLQLILQKQKNCNDEFDKILTIEQQLQDLLSICRIGRTDLELAGKQFTTASLGILANYRKRQIVEDLLRSLTTIKTLQRTEDRVQELLSEQNYPGAISLILECQNAAKTYKHFGCITALTGKLQDTLEQVEQALDATLERMCMQFDGATYASVQDAYYLLGKPETAIDQLHIHFTAAIHHTAFSAIYAHAAVGDPKRQFNQLCQEVSHNNFLPCLEELCKSLWAILSSYHSIVQWHKFKRASDPEQELEASIDKQYAKKKLQNGIVRIWNDVESKISTYLRATTLTHFKFEQFVQILSIVNRLLEIGDKLYGSKSENLQESIRQQCLSYFSHYHALRLDELRIFLEHDGWEMCPVKSTFAVTQLQEFKSLGHVLNSSRNWNNLSDSLSETDSSTSSNANAWLQKCLDEGTSPFGIGLDDTMDEDILNIQDQVDNYFSEDTDDDDVPEELKSDCIDEFEYTKVNKKRHKVRYNGPLVTNTTLSVLRVCGKYLQMIRLLKSIAMTVIESMIQFYELYFFAVHKFFTTDIVSISQSGDYLYSKKLNLTLSRIKNNLIIDDNDEKHLEGKHKVKQPHLSSIVNLSDSEKLYGLAERAAAVESLIFLGQQYENFKSYFEYLTVNSPWSELQQFYAQTIASAGDLRRPIYMQVAYQSIDTKYILQLISKVNWEVRDVMSQHSEYVDVLLQKIKMLRTKLNEIGNNVPLPKEAYALVWENVAFLIARTLVDGFSGAKKCSNGGRALMQLDYTQLASEFENVTSLRPMPFKEYIESYVKAYYLTENVLLAWIQEKKEYTSKHKIGLISCVCQNKKVRQRMIALIEEEQKPITRLHIKSINR